MTADAQTSTTVARAELTERVVAAIDARLTPLRDLRRDLHAHPELSHEEHRTGERIRAALAPAGLQIRALPGTGLVADIGAADPLHRVALRADLDALPVRERTGLDWQSTAAGVCHACGHDLHVAAVVGAGLGLAEVQDELAAEGRAVRLVFQAAEEVIPGGALEAIAAGALQGVHAAYAVHCDPSVDVGQVGLREGPLTAASDKVTVTLTGRGGHTSRPQLTEDLTFALAKVLTEVPAALSRRLDPRAGASLVWGRISAGRAANVIPSSGEVTGTLRVLDASVWRGIAPLLEQVVQAVVAPYGVSARLDHVRGVPPVVNTAAAVEVLRRATLAVDAQPVPTPQSMGGEDFAWYLHHVPGAMARLGTRTPGGRTYDLHQGDLVVDERALGVAARLLAATALSSGTDGPAPERPDPVVVAPR